MKNGVLYGARPLNNCWGIHVVTVRNGAVETEDLNQMPWPTREMAIAKAKSAAISEAEREGMKVVGEIAGDVRPGSMVGCYYRGAA